MSRKRVAAPPIGMQPVAEVIVTLQRLLAAAEAGQIKAVALAFVTVGPPYIGSASGLAPNDLATAHLLTAAVRNLDHEFLHAIRGK